MNTYITWSMTLFALYMARRRKTGAKTKEIITRQLDDFHVKSRTQSFSEDELKKSIDALYDFLREMFNEDFIQSQKEWVVEDYDKIKEIVIGHDGGVELTIDTLLQMIDTYYIIPEGITTPTPEHFKNLDLGGRSQIKVFLEKDTTEFDKRNQFIYILTGGEFKDRLYGATKLREIRDDINFVAIDPQFEALFTMLSPLEALHNAEDELPNCLVVASGSKDNHFGFYGCSTGDVRCSSILGESVFRESHLESGVTCFNVVDVDNEWYKLSPYHGDSSSRVDKVWGAMADITSQGSSVTPTGTERDCVNQLIELTGCAWHPVEHIILAGNAIFGFNVEKMREKGVVIPVGCVEFMDKTLKRILKDKKREIWDSAAWDNFDWQLTEINKDMGESMIKPMLEHNIEIGRKASEWYLDISIYTDEKCPIGENLRDIFKALEPYQFNRESKVCVKSIRAMPRVTPSEMTDEEIHRILGTLYGVYDYLEPMEE